MEKLTVFCFTDIHNQQSMLDYPTTLRSAFLTATKEAVLEFGLCDLAVNGGDNVSDYPYWNKSCAWPKKNFTDLKEKLSARMASVTKSGKVLYVTGNNDMLLGDIGTAQNLPYNTTDFYDVMDAAFGVLPAEEFCPAASVHKPDERYLGAFHYAVGGVHFLGINLDPDSAFNSHDGYYAEETVAWVKRKLCEIDPDGYTPVYVFGHLSALYRKDGEVVQTMKFGDAEAFSSMFEGHKNAFYLYGHLHGEGYCYRESAEAVLHISGDREAANAGGADNRGLAYDLTYIHMGGLRPFHPENFENDGVTGYGGGETLTYFPGTATPKLAQYLVLEIYPDRVTVHVRNAGSLPGYSVSDRPKPYTVYYQKKEKS